MKVWAIYRSPKGAPAPYVVQVWTAAPGAKAESSEPVFAASLEQARETVPAGLEREEPDEHDAEARGLLETWA